MNGIAAPSRTVRWVTTALLAASGLVLVASGLRHPHVLGDAAARMDVVAASAVWVPAHWALTLAQPAAALAVVLAAVTAARRHGTSVLGVGGLVLVVLGLLLGSVATLIAATGLHAAATRGALDAYEVVEHLDLGVGWLCVVVTTTGGILLGLELAGHGRRLAGWTLAGGNGAFLFAAALLPPMHPWTHTYLLRYAAMGMGLVLLVLAAWTARDAQR